MDHIYLDHNSTTPTRPEVIDAMARCYAAGYANPASQHQPGQRSRRVLEDARQRIAEILGADLNRHKPDRLVFTSGGTEANNLAIFGIAPRKAESGSSKGEGSGEKGEAAVPSGRIIVSSIEHASVLEAAEHLLERGWRLDTLPVDCHGVVQPPALESLLAANVSGTRTVPDTFVSVMLANHETGAMQPACSLPRSVARPACRCIPMPSPRRGKSRSTSTRWAWRQ